MAKAACNFKSEPAHDSMQWPSAERANDMGRSHGSAVLSDAQNLGRPTKPKK
jgi:hypothetical protein